MKKLLLCLGLAATAAGCQEPATTDQPDVDTTATATFTNPLLPSGADPWSIYHEGYYYYTHTTGRNVTLWKTSSLTALEKAPSKVVWTPPEGEAYSKEVWAPEIHFLNGAWYIYVAADDGHNRNHRMWVLENPSADPLEGEFRLKGQLKTPDDRWAIDGSVFEHRGQMYFVWSGWEGDENGEQDLYLAKLANPWTVEGERVRISRPTYDWETHGTIPNPGPDDKPEVLVNEGPQPLLHGDRVFVIFSASGCWTEYYALGMLSANADADLMDPASWHKHEEPVFRAENQNGTYAAGHNSFFTSPDGTENWILYHANPEAGQGCGGHRSPRMQPFTWTADGLPDFGTPVSLDEKLPIPSGEE
ncbi:Beta-xylosidase, GH43 family [Catalinimonas alkaloidigena]|uniref:Beta-xylosidase, GH43 family n=1 Tax=Catalinimonas alkaloidigena TaxID=1075417 RepID=A0A1G9A5M2_9BACT|nr:glycoside hydrolase family 43 protein [Catalinimonas alkaloidigena]SDK22636.1 Beta-xylosidase, GH43 family [Catalinimonas alkaloidigena]